jgi:hypothetical protein
MVRRWATGCSKALIVIGIVDMIAKAKVVFAMRHSLDGMAAVDALEHQAWLAVYTLMHGTVCTATCRGLGDGRHRPWLGWAGRGGGTWSALGRP